MKIGKRTTLAILLSSLTCLALPSHAEKNERSENHAERDSTKHILLISVDGLHQSDLEWFVTMHPHSTLARMVAEGANYTNARTPFPSDSFPGMVGQVTGGNPKTTGIYYDDAYSRGLLPAGTVNCAGTKSGAEVFYAEVNAKDPNRLDSGQPISGLYGDLSKIAQLSGHAQDLINPASLPVDPKTCSPVYPHQYLKVNTIFEVAHRHNLRTAWSDKHAAYDILNGPSGKGIDDLFAPEINSSVTDPTPPAAPGDDWTKDNTNTQKYDAFKVKAVLNWIKGYDHSGTQSTGIPAIFGMNFQSVSTAQKLNKSNYYIEPSDPATIMADGLGGYTLKGAVPGPVLQSALSFVDEKLKAMVAAINPSNTVIMLSAKHGQSPQDRAALTIINDGDMIDALNCAWENNSSSCKDSTKPHLVAHTIDDDGILMWLSDRSVKATSFAKHFLQNYSGTGIGSDALGNKVDKKFTHAGTAKIYAGGEAANVIGVKLSDDRVPDLIGVAQYGVVWAGSKLSKIAEHGGNAKQDRHVPIVVWGNGIQHRVVDESVETTQIAPTIATLLELDPNELQAVQIEHTKALPDLHE